MGSSAKADKTTLKGLKEAVEWTLGQGKLDTYLWWNYAATARKLLAAPGSTEDGAAAAAVITACARARVEDRHGVYAAWVKSVGISGANEAPQLTSLLKASLALADAGLMKNKERFWHFQLPEIITSELHTAQGAEIAAAYATYAISTASNSSGHTHAVEEMLAALDKAILSLKDLQPEEAAALLWSQWRCRRLSALHFRHLWTSSLEGGVLDISDPLFTVVAQAAATLRPGPYVAAQLKRSLAVRANSGYTPADHLCRAAFALSSSGMLRLSLIHI